MLQETTAEDGREEEGFEALFNSYADDYEAEDNSDDDARVIEELVKESVDDDGEYANSDEGIVDSDRQSLENRISELEKENTELSHSFKSQVGRVSALQKKIDSESPTARKVSDELTSAMADYPEIVKPMLDYFENRYGDIDQRMAPIQQKNDEQEEQRYIDSQVRIIDGIIPDWRNVVTSSDYESWLTEQPSAIKAMASSYDAVDYQYLIKSFRGTKIKSTEIAQRRQEKLAGNVAIQSKGASKSSSAPEDFGSAWEYYANRKK
jgi:hypothetical protein